MLAKYISERPGDFLNICEENHVSLLYGFGSAVSGDFDKNFSDIDILVEMHDIDPIQRGEKLMSLWDMLEKFFHRKVDLLTDSSLRNPYLRRSIDASKVLIYDGARQKIFI